MKVNPFVKSGLLAVGLAVAAPFVIGSSVFAAQDVTADLTLNNNLTEGLVVKSGHNVTINLNGHNITTNGEHGIYVELGATATIVGNGEVNAGTAGSKAALYNNGTTTVRGGTFIKDDNNGAGGGWYTVLNHGVMNIEDGTFKIINLRPNGGGSSLVDNGYYDFAATGEGADIAYIEGVNQRQPVLNISGGTFIGGQSNIKNDDNGVANVSGGNFSGGFASAIQNVNVMTISGGTFDATGSRAGVIRLQSNGDSSENSINRGILKISNGTFIGDILFYQNGSVVEPVTITGGTFKTSSIVDEAMLNTLSEALKKPVVSGGTFNNPNIGGENVLVPVEGYEVVANDDGTFSVVPKLTEPVVVASESKEDSVTEKTPNTGAISLISSLATILSVAAISLAGAIFARSKANR